MNFVRTSQLFALTGLIAFCAFAGDIVADSIADLRGDHCVSQTSQSDSHHEKAPCSHCSCAVHNGSVITSAAMVLMNDALRATFFVPAAEQSASTGLPAAIDHPPQLA
jgi:hypothetical protein